MALLASCGHALSEHGETGAFGNALVMDDGHTTLFTAKRATFYYTDGDWHGKGRRNFESDELLIGVHDLASGETRVIHREDAEPGADGQSGFTIRSTRGTRALLRRFVGSGAQEDSRRGWYQLDVSTGDLTRLHLDRELEQRGAGKVERTCLVSDAGALLTCSKPVPGQQRFTLSLRSPDGAWREIATDADFRGVKQGELYFWVPDRRLQAWNLSTGELRQAHSREISGLDWERETKPLAAVMARDTQKSQGSYLEHYPDRKDSKVTARLALSIEDLD